jgi:hypothetical protein
LIPKLIQDLPEPQRYRAYVRLGILAFAAVSTYAFAVLLQEEKYWWALIPGAVLSLLSIVEFVFADIYVDSRFPRETAEFLERLERKLASTTTHNEILAVLNSCVDSFAACDKSRISSTVHLTIDLVEAGTALTSKGLVQISDYTRHGLGGRRWRVVKATQGIVGRCIRARKLVYVSFPTQDEYTKRMVEEFGFTEDEAKSHTKAARSYLAVPIFNNSEESEVNPANGHAAPQRRHPIGVMYFFSTEAQVFPRAADRHVLEHHAEDVAALLRASGIIRSE